MQKSQPQQIKIFLLAMRAYRSFAKLTLIGLASIALTACGSGSNAGILGLASVFSSSDDSVDFAENSTGVIYTADASDIGSHSLSIAYALSGGDDLDKFSLGAKSGNLWFMEAQDFENLSDANQDNVYEVEISAYEIAVGDDDTKDSFWSVTLSVKLTDVNEAPTFDSSSVVSADENSAGVIYIAAASDFDAGDSHNFSLVGGNDLSMFSLDGPDLSFVSPPDYEIAADSNGDNAYELVIRATDSSSLSADLNLTVYVTDVNEAPTITSSASNLLIPENTSDVIYEITATDAENDTLGYEIAGADSAAFSISGSAISFNGDPDYEFPTDTGFDNTYNITIEVSDASNVTSQALTIAVDDLNDNIPAIVAAQNFGVEENSTAETILGAVEASDGDVSATTYQDWKIKDGNTNGAFAIDPSSGELSVANSSALDYESGTTSYALTLTVSDGVNTSSPETVNVNIYNVNEPPVIDPSQSFSIDENEPNGTTFGVVTAKDVDASTTLQGWTIIDGNTNAAFDLNASTGVLSVNKSSELDYESGTTSYFLAITVSDGVDTSSPETLTVNINNLNDSAPVINSAQQSFSVYENSANDTSVGTVSVSDADIEELNTFTWSITDGNTDSAFAINASSGEITVATSSELDHETIASYTLKLQVSDGVNTSTEANLRIDIKDLNDNRPDIEAGITLYIDEDSADNIYVGTVNATDADSASVNTFTWSITGGNADDIFAIETGSIDASSGYASSGDITVANSSEFDYETQSGYELTITVSDGNSTSFGEKVKINLKNVNEAPFFTSAPAVTTSENNQFFVYTATADDLDDGDSASLSYSLIGGADQSLFNLNGAALSFIAPPDYETLPDSGDNTYEVELQVTDNGGLSDELNLSISVVDTNDNAPVITVNQTFTIDENSDNSTPVGEVQATDADEETVYQDWTITAASVSGVFTINDTSGQITVANSSALNYESDIPSYTLTLTVSDGIAKSAEQKVIIDVDDVNESPVINSTSVTKVSVAENINHETYIVYQATATGTSDAPLATDPEGDTLTYSLSGEDASLFTIDSSDGIIKFRAAPNYDTPTDADKNNEYKIIIEVSDSIHSVEHALTVELTDVDEPPVIHNTTFSISVNENIATEATIYEIDAADPEDQTLTYSLDTDSDDHEHLLISANGKIRFATTPNYESPADANTDNVYQVTFQISDGELTTEQELNITVINVNEPPAFSTLSASASTNENNIAVFYAASATDEDVDDSITYSLASEKSDNDLFAIGSINGHLQFKNEPDYETYADYDQDGTYEVNISVSDGSLSSELDLALVVTINDVNEFPVFTSLTAIDIDENDGGIIYIASANDVDAGDTLTYAIIGGADQSAFSLTSDGDLSFNNAPNYESPTDSGNDNIYEVQLKVTDDGGLSDDLNLSVSINDLNEHNAIFSSPADANTSDNILAESAATGAAVGITASASDADGTNNTITYSFNNDSQTSPDALFRVDINSGIVTLVDAGASLDYESATSHELVIKATSSDSSSASTTFTVLVTDVDEFDVTFATNPDSNSSDNEVSENAGAGTLVGITASANDADATTNAISYSFANGTQTSTDTLFSIASDTGTIALASGASLNYETAISHELVVKAVSSDGSSASASFTVQVTDVDEFDVSVPTDIDTANANNEIAEDAIAGTAVGITASASDADGSDIVSYSFDNDKTTDGVFSIDAISGVVTLTNSNSLDYETDTSHEVKVKASSSDGSSASASFTVQVTDVNEHAVSAPTDTNNTDNIVAEDATANTPIGITASASDADGTTNTISYSFANGELTSSPFSINPSDGIVTLASDNSLNYEDTDSYSLEINATSSDGSSASANFTVQVTDVDEFDVVFATEPDANNSANEIAENAEAGTAVGITASASDADGTTNTISYSFADGKLTSGPFSIDSSSGVVTLTSGNSLDYETIKTYNLEIKASSSDGSSASASFTVQVTDVDEFDVVFTTEPDANNSANEIAENAEAGTAVGITASASDADATTNTISYSFADGSPTSGPFSIDSSSGVVRLTSDNSLNYEDTTSYSLEINASSSDGSSASASFTVQVTDVDEFDVSVPADIDTANANNEIAENAIAGTAVGITASASDADGTTNTISYSFADGELTSGPFSIDSSSGVVTLTSDNSLDYETINTYNLEINASSSDGSSASASFTVQVTDVDEFDVSVPTDINTSNANNEIAENAEAGTAVGITASASDADATTNTISYGFADGSPTSGPFSINSSSGVVTLTSDNSLDYEATDSYSLEIYALSSDGSSASASFTVVVTDFDEPPIIDTTTTQVDVAENVTTSYTVYATEATDPEKQALTYSIIGGDDAEFFSIDESSGIIKFKSSVPDYDQPSDANTNNDYELTIQVSDGNNLVTHSITIYVTDIDEQPIFNNSSTSVDIAENVGIGVTVYEVNATDPERKDLSYSLSGDDESNFTIDSDGAMRFVESPNYEDSFAASGGNDYQVTIKITDGSHTISPAITINVTDINEAPTVDAGNDIEVSEGATVTLSASASDPDADDTLSYSWQEVDSNGNALSPEYLSDVDTTGARLTFTAPEVVASTANLGVITLTFQLTVTDDDEAKDQSLVEVEVHNLPVIQSVYLQDDDSAYGIGDTATVYIQAGKSETGLKLKEDSSFNGGVLTNFTEVGGDNDGLYSASYLVESEHASVANGGTVTTSIVLEDDYGHESASYKSVTLDGEYIDTEPPSQKISAIDISDDTGTSNADFITNIAAQTITAELNATLEDGDILYGSVTSDDDGNPVWLDINGSISAQDGTSINWSTTLSSGTDFLIQFKVVDAAGNDGQVAKQAYTLDIEKPAQTISAIALSADTGTSNTDLITNTASQTISATLSAALGQDEALYASFAANAELQRLYGYGATISDTDPNTANIQFSAETTLAEGDDNAIVFQVVDLAGNVGSIATEGYILDTEAPKQEISAIALSADTGTSNTDLITNIAKQTISATLDVALDTQGGDILYGSVASNDAGLIWTDITTKINNSDSTSIIWDDVPLSTGTHDLIFRITDIADNNTTFDEKYTLDQTPPNIVISNIAFSDDTGTSDTDLITNIATQTISATLDVALDTQGGDILYGSVASNDAGLIWTDITAKINNSNDGSINITWDGVTLEAGTNDLIFRITDIADNNTTFDEKYTLDQTPPNIVISNIAFSDDTGTSDTDLITNIATQTISATLDVDLDTDGGDILYGSVTSNDAGLIWTDITAKINNSNDGSINITWDGVTLEAGTNDLIFRITDIADNNTTFDKKYTLDQTPPNIVISDIAFSTDTGTSDTDLITNIATQTISATLDVDLDTDGGDILYGSVTSNDAGLIWTDITAKINNSNDGSINITWDGVTLEAGTNDLIFRITDIADNNTTFDEKYTLDQTPPNIVISNIAFSDDTGTSDTDLITNIATQTISATLDVDLDTDGGDILYGSVTSNDAGLIWTDITAKINNSNDGSINITWDGVTLEAGTNDLIFRITDIADNNTTFDEKYTLDQTPPNIVISNIAFSDDTGTSDTDLITNIATQTISATLDVDLDTDGGDILYGSVTSNDAGLIWTDITAKINNSNDGSINITWDGVTLEAGTNDLIFRITDIADNNTTFDEKYTLDQTPPNIVISNIAFSDDTGTSDTDLITNIATQTISATLDVDLDTDGGDILYGSVTSNDAGLIWTDITAKINNSNDGSINITWDGVTLEAGTNDLIFRITDIADNNTTFDEKYTLDQTPPNIVISNIAFSDDTGTSDTDLITNIATQTISATLDVDLDTDGGDILYGSVTSNDAGLIWTDITAKINNSNDGSINITWDGVTLEAGTNDLIFRITDIADNNTTFDKKYTLDQTPPNIVISNIAFSDDTGTSDTDLITNIATQTISATLDVDLDTDGGDILYGSVTSNDAGLIWTDITAKINNSNDGSINITWDGVTLEAGTNDLIFRITDIADNNTTFDEKYTLDQTPPNIVISNIAFSDDTGTSDTDLITNIATQTISATLDVDLDTDGGDILYGSVTSNDAGLIWTDITAKINNSNDGSINITWDGVTLEAGTNDLIFRITDIADNNTTFDEKYTLDQTPPNIVISNIAFSDDTGTSDTDLITNIATQTISATLDVDLDTDGGDILYGSVTSNDAGLIWTDITAKINNSNDGSINITWDGVTLEAGTNDLIFRITDIADNNTTFDKKYTLDQTPPNIVISNVAFSDDTGTSDTDLITNIATQTISATLDVDLDTDGGDILYGSVTSNDAGLIWTDITAKINNSNDGSINITWDGVTLEAGTNDLIFRITDIADNNTTFDEKYTLDQTPPNIVISNIAFSDDTGTSDTDLITNIATQTISATLDVDLDTDGGDILYGSVTSNDAGLIWTDITTKINTSDDDSISISWDGVELSTGTHDLIFRITDIADNNTTVSREYTLDQTPPGIDTSGTASEVSEAFDAALDASDSSDDGSGIASYVWQQVAADGGAWSGGDTLVITSANSATTSASTPGIADDVGADLSFYFAVTIIDIAGNSATSSALPLTVTNAYKTPDITASAGTAPDFGELSLSWTATSGLTYNLHRSSASGCDLSATGNCANYLEYAALDLSSGTHVDTGLDLFSSYYYWLEAQLNGEIVSLSSAPLEANTTGPALNDTGVVQGADYPNGFDSLGDGVCNGGYIDSNDDDDDGDTNEFIAFANEDCELGRDATNNDDSDGHAGFSFTKLDSAGNALDASAEAWSCVLDNVTGLIWEVKTTDGTLRDKDKTFTWYDSDNSTFKGTQSDQDTDDLITYVNGDSSVNNGSGLCGLTNWRLPTATEMVSLRNNSIVVGNSNFSVDSDYFPNLSNVYYWTSSVNHYANADGDDNSTTYPIWNHGAEDMVSSSSNGSSSDLRYAILVSSSSTSANDYFNDWSDERYEIHNDGTVSDKRTGLMWMRCGYDDEFAFYDSATNTCVENYSYNHGAAAYPDALGREIQLANKEISNGHNNYNNNIGSYTDWRLPNLTELFSLRDHTAGDADTNQALINPEAFPNAEATAYWTSTPRAISTGGSVYWVSFSPTATSAFSFSGMNNAHKLRLVRDDIKTPRILTLNINGDNIVNASDSSNLGAIPVSGTTGDVESGQQLSLVLNDTTYSADIANDGSFTTTIDLSTLADGTYTITADVSDLAGKAANQFTSTLTKDLVLPTITEVIVATDDTINIAEDSAATISGTTGGVEDGQILSLVISDGTITVEHTTSVNGNSFNVAANLSQLKDSSDSTNISLSANVADAAGNSAATFTNTLIKDTVAPTIAITSIATDDKINASEASTAVIIGTASEDGQSVALAITDGSTTVEATSIVVGGSYSATVDLSSLAESTSISLSTTILDTAGNDATTSKTGIVKDTIAPSIASISVADNNFVNSKELDESVAVSGVTSGVEDYQAITITINGEDISTNVIASTFTTDADLSDLDDGTYSLSANVADAASNPAEEFNSSFIIETVPPTQAVKPDSISLSHDTSSSTSYFLTNQAAQTISAELNASLGSDEALYASVDSGSTWLIIYDDENLTDATSFSWDTTLQEGTHSIYFRVTDTADNNSTDTTQAYTLDLSEPQISSDATASIAENTSGTVYTAKASDTETEGLALSLSYSLSGTDAAQLSIDPESGAISFASPPDYETPTDASTGAEGSVDAADTNNTYQVTLEASDPAGNTATQALTITVTDLNDEEPVIDAGQTFSIMETSDIDGTVGTVAVIDADTVNTFTWSITNTDTNNVDHTTIENPRAYFDINSSTGQITVAQKLTVNGDGSASYNVTLNIQVNDGATDSAVAEVTIEVQAAILPDDFRVVGIGAYVVKLTWTKLASDLYYIYRSSSDNCDLANYTSCADGNLTSSVTPPFFDIVPKSGIPYYYWLEAKRSDTDLTQTSPNPINATPEPRLNDTGINWGGDHSSGNNSDCSSNISAPQDCDHGLDAGTTTDNDADGNAGLSYTRLNADGSKYTGSGTYSSEPWSCVHDNVTGLIWEVKTNDDGLHDKDNTYTWYSTNTATNGGDGNSSVGTENGDNDTEAFVAAVNSDGLCGATDWRLPTISELISIASYDRNGPAIDTSYFPNTVGKGSHYWSSMPIIEGSGAATRIWALARSNSDFKANNSDGKSDSKYSIRLVRDGLLVTDDQ